MNARARSRRVLGLAAAAVLPVALVTAAGPAAADAGPAGCGLQLMSSTRSAGQAQLLVSAPAVAQTAPPVRRLTLSQNGLARPVTARAVASSDLAVAVVLASSPGTSSRDFERGRDAALELLVSLPAPARTVLLSTDRTRPKPTLSADRAASTEGLRDLRPGAAGTEDDAVLRAAGLLPGGGHVVLVTDSGPAPSPALDQRLRAGGLFLDRIGYGPPAAAAAGCPSPSASVLRQVDEVSEHLTNRYRLTVGLDPSRPATLSVSDTGVVSQVVVPPTATPGSAGAALADPYPRRPGSSAERAASYGGAAVLGLLGLVLLLLRRPGARDGGTVTTAPLVGSEPVDAGRSLPVGSGW